MTEAGREKRIGELRWQLSNARRSLEGDLELYKEVHAAGHESKALSVHERICATRRSIPGLEAELARLEREAQVLAAGGEARRAVLLEKAAEARKNARCDREAAAATLARAERLEIEAQRLEAEAGGATPRASDDEARIRELRESAARSRDLLEEYQSLLFERRAAGGDTSLFEGYIIGFDIQAREAEDGADALERRAGTFSQRESRLRALRQNLRNARQMLEGHLAVAKAAEARGDSKAAAFAHQGADANRPGVRAFEAELAELEKQAGGAE